MAEPYRGSWIWNLPFSVVEEWGSKWNEEVSRIEEEEEEEGFEGGNREVEGTCNEWGGLVYDEDEEEEGVCVWYGMSCLIDM